MTQEELKLKYKETENKEDITYASASRYFKSAVKHYLPLQDGVADETNYYDYTLVIYQQCEKPDGEADYTSLSGSRYWYTKDGVIRGSNHWGNGVDKCDWALKMYDGKTVYGINAFDLRCFKDEKFGFAKWTDFVHKARLLDINGTEVVTTFNNYFDRDHIKIDGKVFHRVIIQYWEETEE